MPFFLTDLPTPWAGTIQGTSVHAQHSETRVTLRAALGGGGAVPTASLGTDLKVPETPQPQYSSQRVLELLWPKS